MLRRGGNRLAVLLMTGVLLGDLWSWGARWLEMALSPWEPTAQTDCDHGSMIDPNGQCRSLLVEQQGPLIDPDGEPKPDDGPLIDPNS
ncbi:MAG TPA: hypothetical protein VH394_06715 [Thermoanaerobaculia bacterium]|jgi:hypothetical protein|nr:hypothetical protein [Thermoanaerobaculia bacterium]